MRSAFTAQQLADADVVVEGEITEENGDKVAAFATIASLCAAITKARSDGFIDQKALDFIVKQSARYGDAIVNSKKVEVEIESRLADLVNIFARGVRH